MVESGQPSTVQGVQLRKRDSQQLTEAPHKKDLDIYVVIIAKQMDKTTLYCRCSIAGC